ncbi:MAG: hypothetical protein J5911_04775 [Clostridia bacterium]|nr:hypothetical protein [Clostridia bacterium]
MDILQLIGLEELGVKIAVLALIVGTTDFLLKTFGAKIPKIIVNYAPLPVAVFGAVIAELITSGQFRFTTEEFYSGVMAYSLGTVLSVAVRKLLHGESTESTLLMLVSGIAENVCVKNASAEYSEIVRILDNLADVSREDAKEGISSQLKKAAREGVSDAEILAAAEIILLSAQNLRKEK